MFLSRTWLICRVCMQQTMGGMVNLFSHISDQPVWNLLRDCGGIPVRKNDNLPDKICDSCLQRLWKAHAFRLDCQRAHRQITQVVPTPFPNDEEFLPDDEPFRTSLLDEFHARIIDKFEADKGNEYIGSYDGTGSFSKTDSDTVITTTYNKQRHTNNSTQDEFDDVMIDQDVECCPITNKNEAKDTEHDSSVHPQMKRMISSKSSTTLKRTKTKDTTTRSTSQQRSLMYACSVCDNTYASAELLRHHKYIHMKRHMCKICGKFFAQKQQFKNHENSHFGIQPYSCRICSKTFADTSNRNKHEKNVHKRNRIRKCPKPRKCLICNRLFASLSNLRAHHRSIHLKAMVTPE